jgi:hypothetical protein
VPAAKAARAKHWDCGGSSIQRLAMEHARDRFVEDLQLIHKQEAIMGRGILLWMLGIPLPIILLLAFFR